MHASGFKSYVICTSPRSGSTLLCALLKATGKAGRPASLFHKPSLADWLEYYGLERSDFLSEEDALRAVFDHARAKGSGKTGIFGVRLQRQSFPFFMKQADRLYPDLATDVARIEAAFGPMLYVYLQREDFLAQAVSN